jgi:hypothetical protein
MRMVVGILATVFLIAPALAQTPALHLPMGAEKTLSDDDKARNAQREHDYNSAIGQIPDQKPADPWGNVRDAGTQSSKTTKKGSQTGSQ